MAIELDKLGRPIITNVSTDERHLADHHARAEFLHPPNIGNKI